MNKLRKYIFVFLVQCLCIAASFSQETMRINGTQIVKKGETLTIDAGRIVEFEAGATLIVEGSIVVRGTIDNPVIMKSMDLQNPGNGIMVKGIDENGSVVMDNVRISGLIQPLRFDPFWYRKSVDLKSMVISAANSGEPVIYVAGPLLDLRDGMDIRFSMNSLKFYNNSGSVLLEKVGSDGIVYDLDKLLFSDNTLPGSDVTMGVLHLDVARALAAGQLKIGELAFNRNTSGINSVGLSLSGGNGTGSEKLSAGAVYGEKANTLIYDNRINSRVPSLEIGKVAGLNAYSEEKDFVIAAKHTFGKVKMNVVGNPRVVKMEDSLGRPVFNNASRIGDTLVLLYLEGNPTVITLANGQKFMVPKLTAAELPPPIYRRVDTTLISPTWPDTTKIGEGDGGAGVQISFKLPTFGGKKVKVTVMKEWEMGLWAGGAMYGGGDIKHKFSPIPSTIEISSGLYGQYNLTSRFSMKGSYYRSAISIHNLWATGLFTGGLSPKAFDNAYNEFTPFGNAYSVMFYTKMNVLEFEGLWHLKDYKIRDGRNSRLVPTLGISLGVLQYTPYRYAYTGQKSKETYEEYVSRMKNENLYDMRKFGSEGQNFLPGAKQYSQFTTSIGTSFSIAYIRKKWSFKGELKAVYTSTDYLDDFGPGLWYGGDYQKMIDNQQSVSQDDPRYSAQVNKLSSYNPRINTSTYRSTNGLNDWYFQAHMGISYNLSYGKKKQVKESLK